MLFMQWMQLMLLLKDDLCTICTYVFANNTHLRVSTFVNHLLCLFTIKNHLIGPKYFFSLIIILYNFDRLFFPKFLEFLSKQTAFFSYIKSCF